MAQVETTAGAIDASEMGRTLAHEHLRTTSENIREQYPHLYDPDAEFELAVTEIRKVMEHGVKTVIDPACMDLGRDPRFAKRVADETGVQLVMCTGVYGQHYTFLPQHFQNHDEDYLADAFVHDIEEGIQGTEVKAAFLKCAADEPGITPDVEKVHRAIARASNQTGKPIMAHSRPASGTGLEQMEIFQDEGVAPERVQIAHTGDTDDLDYIEKLLATGCYVGLDRFGIDLFLPDEKRIPTAIELVKRGHTEKLTLSCDAVAVFDWFPRELVQQMLPNWTMDHLFKDILPALTEGGVGNDAIDVMLDEVPRRWLAGE